MVLESRSVKPRSLFTVLVCAFAFLVTLPASAQLYTQRSYVLTDGSVELGGEPARPLMAVFGINDDADPFEPVVFPIHVYFGVTNDLTLGVTHDRGPCFNCGDEFYNGAGPGMGLLYNFVRTGSFELDLHLTAPLIRVFDPFMLAVRGGVIGRVNISHVVAFVFDPSLLIGLTERDQGNQEVLGLPFWFFFQATDVVVPFVGSGIYAPLDDGEPAIPLEGGVIASVNRNIDLGGALLFGNLNNDGGALDFRALGFIGRFRFD
jgi:hypothetical protein